MESIKLLELCGLFRCMQAPQFVMPYVNLPHRGLALMILAYAEGRRRCRIMLTLLLLLVARATSSSLCESFLRAWL